MINKYETKPCIIRAVQWTGDNLQELIAFGHGDIKFIVKDNKTIPIIETLEGVMEASPLDYLIEGLRGEFYPCKWDVFQKKYKMIEEDK